MIMLKHTKRKLENMTKEDVTAKGNPTTDVSVHGGVGTFAKTTDKRRIYIVLAGLILLLLLGGIIAYRQTNDNELAINAANQTKLTLDTRNTDKLHAAAATIEQSKKYSNDANMLYILTVDAITRSDITAADKYLNQLQKVKPAKSTVNDPKKLTLDQLKSQIDFLKQVAATNDDQYLSDSTKPINYPLNKGQQ